MAAKIVVGNWGGWLEIELIEPLPVDLVENFISDVLHMTEIKSFDGIKKYVQDTFEATQLNFDDNDYLVESVYFQILDNAKEHIRESFNASLIAKESFTLRTARIAI